MLESERAFDVTAILAAISVPLLPALVKLDILVEQSALIRIAAVAGSCFLVAALFSLFRVVEVRAVPGMTVASFFLRFLVVDGALLVGLGCLLAFHIWETSIVW